MSESCTYVTPIRLGQISRTNQIAPSKSASNGRKFAFALRTAIFVFWVKHEEVFNFDDISPFLGVHLR